MNETLPSSKGFIESGHLKPGKCNIIIHSK